MNQDRQRHSPARWTRVAATLALVHLGACTTSADPTIRTPAVTGGATVTAPGPASSTPPTGTPPTDTAPPAPDTGDTGQLDTGPPPPCPPGMVQLDAFCIDAWEAHLEGADPYAVPESGVAAASAGAVPQAYISADVADAACTAAGKRLCTTDEWLRACQGPDGRTYPYGDAYDPDACNDTRASHPIIDLFGDEANWLPEQMNDPRLNQLPDSLDPAGANPGCVTPEGVFDLHGNLHEWVADADGTFRGGFYVDAVLNGPGCTYRTTAHSRGYHDYSTGFRCCADTR